MLDHSVAVVPPGPDRQRWCPADCKLNMKASRIFICFVPSSLLRGPVTAYTWITISAKPRIEGSLGLDV